MGALRGGKYYKFIVWGGFALCIALGFWLGTRAVMQPGWFQADDFPEYWAAGRINLRGGNPYDPAQLLQEQKEAGRWVDTALMMWNPPWALPLVTLFGFGSYPIGRTAWLFLSIFLVFVGAHTLWGIYGGNKQKSWVSWLLGFTFIPVLVAIKKGQSSILVLLGIVGFLYFIRRRQPWPAGLCLALLLVKPHLAYLLLLAAILWSVQRRAWQLLAGMTLPTAGATLAALALNPQVIAQYMHAISAYPPSDWATPTLGGVLRLAFGVERFWLQFLPPALGALWLAVYWLRQRASWDWQEQIPLIVLVSLATTAYGWSFDQPAALAAIILVFVLLASIPWRMTTTLILLAYLVIDLLASVMPGNDFFRFWLAPVLLAWYLASRRLIQGRLRPDLAFQASMDGP